MSAVEVIAAKAPKKTLRCPRVGFLGVGWIGRHRLEAIARSGAVQVSAIAEPVEDLRR